MDGVTALQKHLVRVKLEHAEREAALERTVAELKGENDELKACLLYTSPSPRDVEESRMPSSA